MPINNIPWSLYFKRGIYLIRNNNENQDYTKEKRREKELIKIMKYIPKLPSPILS